MLGNLINIPILVKNLTFSGIFRIEIDLCKEIPFAQCLKLSMLEIPVVDFQLIPLKSVDLLDLPYISGLIDSIINKQVSAILLYPKAISVDLEELVKYSGKVIGVIEIFVISLETLKDSNYQVELENMKVFGKTSKKPGVDPIFNEVFYEIISDTTKFIDVIVKANNSVLTGKIFLRNLNKHYYSEKVNVSNENDKAYLSVSTKFYPIVSSSSKSIILYISLISIRDLQCTGDPKNKLYSTYCELILEKKDGSMSRINILESKRIFVTKDPFFNQSFKFFVKNIEDCQIRIIVKNEKNDQELGFVVLNLLESKTGDIYKYRISGVECGCMNLKFKTEYLDTDDSYVDNLINKLKDCNNTEILDCYSDSSTIELGVTNDDLSDIDKESDISCDQQNNESNINDKTNEISISNKRIINNEMNINNESNAMKINNESNINDKTNEMNINNETNEINISNKRTINDRSNEMNINNKSNEMNINEINISNKRITNSKSNERRINDSVVEIISDDNNDTLIKKEDNKNGLEKINLEFRNNDLFVDKNGNNYEKTNIISYKNDFMGCYNEEEFPVVSVPEILPEIESLILGIYNSNKLKESVIKYKRALKISITECSYSGTFYLIFETDYLNYKTSIFSTEFNLNSQVVIFLKKERFIRARLFRHITGGDIFESEVFLDLLKVTGDLSTHSLVFNGIKITFKCSYSSVINKIEDDKVKLVQIFRNNFSKGGNYTIDYFYDNQVEHVTNSSVSIILKSNDILCSLARNSETISYSKLNLKVPFSRFSFNNQISADMFINGYSCDFDLSVINGRGELEIFIIKVIEIKYTINNPSAFVRVLLNKEKIYSTDKKQNNYNPTFNESLKIKVQKEIDVLCFEILNFNSMTNDTLIGFTEFPLFNIPNGYSRYDFTMKNSSREPIESKIELIFKYTGKLIISNNVE